MRERLRALLFRSREERDLEGELRFHIEMETAKLVGDGIAPEEARRRAIIAFGGVERYKEAVREAWGTQGLENLWADLRYAARTLRKSPGFTLVAVLTLALGIGATTAIFSVVDGVLLRPMAVRDQDRVVVMWARGRLESWAHVPLSFDAIRAFRERARAFDGLAAIDYNGATARAVEYADAAAKMKVAFVTGNLFSVLGATPELGRTLRSDDARVGAAPVAVISHGLWRRAFGADPAVLGSTLSFFGRSATVVGVMAPGFDVPTAAEVWAPIVPFTTRPGTDSSWVFVHLVGRLGNGATAAHAAADLDAFLSDDDVPAAPDQGELTAVVQPLLDVVAGPVRPAVVALSAAAALLLLIACANTASLLLVRASARRHELATRISLGAGRWRIARQMMVESTVLAAVGGALAIAVAFGAVAGLLALAPEGFPRLDHIRIDGRVLWFGVATTFLTAALFGTAPAVWAARTDPSALHRGRGGARGRAAPGARRPRQGLVVLQVALALVVLTAAGLVTRSFDQLRQLDLGLAADRVIVAELAVSRGEQRSGEEYWAMLDRIVARVQSLPGVAAATTALMPPFTGASGWDAPYLVEGQSENARSANPVLNLLTASPTYFRTLGIPLLRGRTFMERDRDDAPLVAVLSESAARRAWPGQDPLGSRIRVAGAWRTVVGIVGDTRYRSLTRVHPTVYLPVLQSELSPFLLAVRARTKPDALIPVLRRVVEQTAPGLYVPAASTVAGLARAPLARPRLNAAILSGFGFLALVLTAIGLYGVVAAHVRQREAEIGIRMALGARAGSVLGLVVGQGAKLAGIGVVIGLVLASALTRVLSSLLFGVSATDPLTFAAVAVLLAGVALIACYIPARRAIGVDPAAVLRAE